VSFGHKGAAWLRDEQAKQAAWTAKAKARRLRQAQARRAVEREDRDARDRKATRLQAQADTLAQMARALRRKAKALRAR